MYPKSTSESRPTVKNPYPCGGFSESRNSLFDSEESDSRPTNGYFKTPTGIVKQNSVANGWSQGKALFDESSIDSLDLSEVKSGNGVSIGKAESVFAPPPPTDSVVEERYRVGQGPYKFDVNSIPPAPSMKGRVEVERLIHAYRVRTFQKLCNTISAQIFGSGEKHHRYC